MDKNIADEDSSYFKNLLLSTEQEHYNFGGWRSEATKYLPDTYRILKLSMYSQRPRTDMNKSSIPQPQHKTLYLGYSSNINKN